MKVIFICHIKGKAESTSWKISICHSQQHGSHVYHERLQKGLSLRKELRGGNASGNGKKWGVRRPMWLSKGEKWEADEQAQANGLMEVQKCLEERSCVWEMWRLHMVWSRETECFHEWALIWRKRRHVYFFISEFLEPSCSYINLNVREGTLLKMIGFHIRKNND